MERNNIMNRKQYKLQQLSDRLWTCAANTALVAAALGRDGRGFALVAEETRTLSNKAQDFIERALFEDEEIKMEILKDAAHEIMFLAYNAAIESHRLEEKGKQAAVCADEIRSLAYTLTTEISDDMPLDRHPENIVPWAKTPLTTVISNNLCFFLFEVPLMHFRLSFCQFQEARLHFHAVHLQLKIHGHYWLSLKDRI